MIGKTHHHNMEKGKELDSDRWARRFRRVDFPIFNPCVFGLAFRFPIDQAGGPSSSISLEITPTRPQPTATPKVSRQIPHDNNNNDS
jgi:hypothetical protein